MDALLEEFAGLFAEPQGLPLRRHLSHCIRLKRGVGAVAVRPYRYAHTQKDELERQCDEMLRQDPSQLVGLLLAGAPHSQAGRHVEILRRLPRPQRRHD